MTLRQRINAFLHPEEIKVNPAYSGMIQYSDTPKPKGMDKNYKSYAKEGYRNNDTVYKCISYIARNGAAIPPVLYTDASRKEVIPNHKILDKLNKPNPEQSGVAYREAVLSYKLLSGNAFQYAIKPSKNDGPAELWPLQPDLVSIIPAPQRGIIGYQFEPLKDKIITPNLIGHTKYWHPENALYGLSPLEVAALMVDQNKAAKTWNLALLQNSARPPGAWVVPVPLSKNDREKLERNIKEKLAGYKNAGTIPVLDAGLDFKSLGLPPQVMEWLEGIQYNAAMIANVYSLAPQIIGDSSASTYNNMKEAKAASYTEAIFPELDDFYALMTAWLVPMYPDLANSGACLGYDKETVEVISEILQEKRQAKADAATKIWTGSYCTMNEAREMVGLPPDPQGDLYKFGAILVKRGELDKYAEQSLTTPAAPPMPQPEPIQDDPQQNTGKDVPSTGQNKPGKKYFDANNIYQPDNLNQQLAKLNEQGIQRIQWKTAQGSCDQCSLNDNQIVEVGQVFKNGLILPPGHPNCNCQVIPVTEETNEDTEKAKSYLSWNYEETQTAPIFPGRNNGISSREEYRQFIKKVS